MRISVRIKPNSRTEAVEKLPGGDYLVRVRSPAVEGKANEALVEALSDYFDIPKSRISIAKGLGSKNKIVDIF
jgi:hypothetical protein